MKSKLFFSVCLLGITIMMCACNSASDKSSLSSENSRETEILSKMSEIHQQREALLPRIESAYNNFCNDAIQHGYIIAKTRQGSYYWRLHDLKEEMMSLCDEYIRLAKQLNNDKELNDALIQKQGVEYSFNLMKLQPSDWPNS